MARGAASLLRRCGPIRVAAKSDAAPNAWTGPLVLSTLSDGAITPRHCSSPALPMRSATMATSETHRPRTRTSPVGSAESVGLRPQAAKRGRRPSTSAQKTVLRNRFRNSSDCTDRTAASQYLLTSSEQRAMPDWASSMRLRVGCPGRFFELTRLPAVSPGSDVAVSQSPSPLTVTEVESQTACVVVGAAEGVGTGLTRWTLKHGPVAIVSVAMGDERVESQVAREHIESLEVSRGG
jgi:hypothetical protein